MPSVPESDFGAPSCPPPSDIPPNPASASVSDTIASSEDDDMLIDTVGAANAGAGARDGCCCAPKPKPVLPNAEGVPENALKPPLDVVVFMDPNADGAPNAGAGAGDGGVMVTCVCAGAGVGVAAEAETMPG